ncbi:MAG: N-6 DNA methylase [Dehalococcoidia bacterium]|nr:N-6 DNA methylase [Dehalococcoidia bacterium]
MSNAGTEAAKEKTRQEIAKLVDKYQNLPTTSIRKYTEADTRRVFILPLFEALGWDVYSREEVAEEVKTPGGRVDYVFKLHGVSQFYLEAKALRVELSKPEYIKQAITYAYNKGMTWAVLTDFEGLQVYNAQTGRLFINLSCSDYLRDFDDLWLLSKESLEHNALNERAEKYGALPPRLGIEQRLYNQLRHWRETLFTRIYHYNQDLNLNYSQIDEVIQTLFNRLIFIRTCEDRRIEDRVLLGAVHEWQSAGRKGERVEILRRIFRHFDGYYDSDLFALHLTDQVFIDSVTIEGIINGLYEIPGGMASYDFSLIDADVLGAVYEQYLGHVATVVKQRAEKAQIRMDLGFPSEPTFELTAKKQRRKEHGIYYTPRFVTDYIVKQTVGRFLKERSHNEILNIKILDPACGSGSFLIRAYDELLGYHADKRGKPVSELDQWERLPILTGNIFGVDLDIQAIEIARLNLLLRSLARRETLPSLADNIRQGNSLISGTEDELKRWFSDNWREKKPFNWEHEFDDTMAKGGFDIVIGNPPYVRIQALPRDEADYYREHYQSAFGSFDVYILFLEQAIKLLKPGGRFGFITSGKFLKADYGKKIQQTLHRECTVESIIDLSAQQVFAQATTYPVIMVFQKGAEEKSLTYTFIPANIDLSEKAQPIDASALPTTTTNQQAVVRGVWPPITTKDTILAKLSQNTVPLAELADRIFQGLVTSADKIYTLEKRAEPNKGLVKVYSRNLGQECELENALLKPLLSGKDMERYGYPIPNQLLLFPYKVSEGDAELISPEEFASSYPRCWQYVLQNKEALQNRERGKMRHEKWYAYVYPKNLALHDKRKIAIPRLVSRLTAVYDQDAKLYLDNVDVGGLILREQSERNCLYIAGLLNSRLLDYYLHRISVPFRGGFYSANRQFLEPLPIRRIDFDNPSEKKMHDDLVALADKMLELNKRLAPIRNTPCNERDQLVREIERTDKELDNLVYDLYSLTDEERKIVEGS